MKDNIGISGQIRLECHRLGFWSKLASDFLSAVGRSDLAVLIIRKYGILKYDTGFIKNTITNAGLAVISGLVGNTGSQTAFTYLAVGTSSTAPAASQTTLGGEISTNGLGRAAATVSRVTTTQTNDTLRLLKAFAVSGTSTVEEAGMFNASSSGVMLNRALTATKPVVNGDTLTVTYDVKFA